MTKNNPLKSNHLGIIDCLFINPMDMIASVPYVKSLPLIAVLREAGLRVKLIDPAPQNKKIKDIIQVIKNDHPSLLCVSAVPSTLPFTYKLIEEVKKLDIKPIIIIEGYHVNADPSIVKELDIDYGLIGDGDYVLLELCQRLLNKEPIQENMDGLVIHKNGNLIVNKPALVKDLNTLPIPAFDLMQIGKYFSGSTNKVIMHLFTARGCPYECNFCTIPNQKTYRYLSIGNTIKQIRYLVNDLKIEWIEFMDLTFTTNRKRTIELCEAICDNNIQFQWGCETRADLVDDELLIAMKKAGCKKITFGVESGNEEVRFKTGKKITNKQFKIVFDLCRKHKLKTMANFIIGHPNETIEQVEETISFANEIKPFNVLFNRMTPLPDVDIFSEGVKNGEIDKKIWSRYMKGEIDHPIYYPKTIPPQKVERLFRKAMFKSYINIRTIRGYLSLFLDFKFFIKSVLIFLTITFSGPKFK